MYIVIARFDCGCSDSNGLGLNMIRCTNETELAEVRRLLDQHGSESTCHAGKYTEIIILKGDISIIEQDTEYEVVSFDEFVSAWSTVHASLIDKQGG